ncbi:MAG: hypothetical protein HY796_06345 [Elusimicrobia bacterium]|nr:hypothetical protein [Elusimicrobiota bacterium]
MIKVPGGKSRAAQYVIGGAAAVIILNSLAFATVNKNASDTATPPL